MRKDIAYSSEALERRPGGVGLGGFLYSGSIAAGKVGEQVEAGPCLDLVDTHGVVLIVQAFQVLMGKPETDGARRSDRAFAPSDLEEGLPVVVRDGEGFAVACVHDCRDTLRTVSFLAESRARHHIHRVAGRCETAQGGFQIAPDTPVEPVLDLRGDIGHVIGLVAHVVHPVAVGAGDLVTAGVIVALVILSVQSDAVGPGRAIGLLRGRDIRVVGPLVGSAASVDVVVAERVGHPVRGVHLRVVKAGVVAPRTAAHRRAMGEIV